MIPWHFYQSIQKDSSKNDVSKKFEKLSCNKQNIGDLPTKRGEKGPV